MKIPFKIISFFIILSCNDLFSQDNFEDIKFSPVLSTNEREITQNSIFAIEQDSIGFMWFGTQSGLNRYDGHEFKPYYYKPDDPTTITKGDVNNLCYNYPFLWIGTDRGISKMQYDLKKNDFIIQRVDSFSGNSERLRSICKYDAGQILYATDSAIYRSGHQLISKLDSKYSIKKIKYIEKNHIIVLATDKGVLYGYLNSNTKSIQYLNIPELENQEINTLYLSKNQEIFFGSKNKVYRYTIDNNTFIKVEEITIDNEGEVSSILLDSKKGLWIGSKHSGLYYQKTINSNPLRFGKQAQKKFQISSYLILSLFESKDGVVWVGTNGGGVNKWAPKKQYFEHYIFPKENSTKDVWSIYTDDKYVYLGTEGYGVAVYDKNNLVNNQNDQIAFWIRHSEKNNSKKNFVRVVREYKGSLLLGTEKGLYKIPITGRSYVYTESNKIYESPENIIDIHCSESSVIVATKGESLVIFDNSLKRIGTFFKHQIVNVVVSTNISGEYIVGTEDGLWVLNLDKKDVKLRKYKDDELKSLNIMSLLYDSRNNTLWVGTDGEGIFGIDPQNGKIKQNINRENGLADNVIYGIIKDNQGAIWSSTNNGLSKISPYNSIAINNYNIFDGLQHQEFNSGAYFYDKNIDIAYFGGVNGLNIFRPYYVKSETLPFPQYAYRFSYPDKKGFKSGVWINQNSPLKIELPYEGRVLELDFLLFDYNDTPNNSIWYQIEKNNIPDQYYFNNQELLKGKVSVLTTGEHILKMAHRLSYGDWNSQESNIYIKVQQPRYRISWIFFICTVIALVAITSVYFINRKKSRRIERQKTKLEKLSFDNTLKQDELKRLNDDIVLKNQHLHEINGLINEITKKESPKEIFRLAVQHLTKSACFGFEFALIYIIDKHDNQILDIFENCTNKDIQPQPRNWRNPELNSDDHHLISNDILSIVFDNNDLIAFVDEVNINILEGNYQGEIILDKVVFEKNNHDSLQRLFLPIVKRSDAKEGQQESFYVFGVIEVGHLKSTGKTINDPSLINFLKLYIDNCAQVYYKVYSSENLINHEDLALKHDNPNPEKYFKSVIDDLVDKYKCDGGGDIALLDMDQDEETWVPVPAKSKSIATKNFNLNELFRIRTEAISNAEFPKGIFRRVAQTKEYYFTGDALNDKYYIPGLNNIHSQLSVPLKSFGKLVGVMNLYSSRYHFFDEFKAKNIAHIAEIITDIYLRKKAYFTLDKMVIPVNTFLNSEKVIEEAVKNVKEYFSSNFVDIVSAEYLTSPIRKEIREIKLGEEITDSLNVFLKGHFKHTGLFKSVIISPFSLDKQDERIILIASKRKEGLLFSDDIAFLSEVAHKCRLSLESIHTLNSLNDLTEPLIAGNPDDVYKVIAETAKKLFDADLALLSRIVPGKHSNLVDVIYSGDLFFKLDEKIARKEPERENVIDHIIILGDAYIMNSDEYINSKFNTLTRNWQSNQFKLDFYHREKIKSFAAIRLGTIENPVGVIFLNYREDSNKRVNFDENFKNMFATFAKVAGRAMENAKLVAENIAFKNANIRLSKPYMESFIISGIAHDTGNLIASLSRRIGNFEIDINAQKTESLDKEIVLAGLARIKKVTELLGTTYLKLKKFRKSEDKIHMGSVNIEKVIDDVVDLIKGKAESKNTEVKIYYKAKPQILCDANYLTQALMNLIINALEEFKESGSNKINIVIEQNMIKREAIIKVQDNGPGINKEELSKVFEVYYTTKKDGTGIGLPITKYIVEEVHNGKINVYSKIREGTTFEIIIPLQQ